MHTGVAKHATAAPATRNPPAAMTRNLIHQERLAINFEKSTKLSPAWARGKQAEAASPSPQLGTAPRHMSPTPVQGCGDGQINKARHTIVQNCAHFHICIPICLALYVCTTYLSIYPSRLCRCARNVRGLICCSITFCMCVT